MTKDGKRTGQPWSGRPWVGDEYRHAPYGQRVMLMGRLPVTVAENSAPGGGQITGPGAPLWRRVAAAFLGKRPTAEELQQFCHAVCYCHHDPVVPSTRGAEEAFFDRLESLQPEVLVVLGETLWIRLPQPEAQGWTLQLASGSVSTREYPYSGGSCRAFPVLKPASVRFNTKVWHARLSAVLRAAAATTSVEHEPSFENFNSTFNYVHKPLQP